MKYAKFTQSERDGWHDRAKSYGSFTAQATMQIIPAMLDSLHLRPGMRLLDVACGPGYVAGAAAALDVQAQGVDYAPGMIEAARARFPGPTFDVADGEDLPFQDAQFNAVACNMGLFHMGDPLQAMHEAFRVLRPDGRFAFSQWTAPSDSATYSTLFAALKDIADLGRAHPAPDAYALSDQTSTLATLAEVGFSDPVVRRLDTKLVTKGSDFFDFFMHFGVRVPLIVDAQDTEIREALRQRINADMQPFKTETGYSVSMPSLLYSGFKS